MDRNNYVDANHAREEKGQGMAWARPKKKAAGRNSVEGFSSMSYASLLEIRIMSSKACRVRQALG